MANFAVPSLRGTIGWWALLIVPALAAGCTITENSLWPAPPAPCKIEATWNNRVAFAADPTQNGKMNPGLAGRLYLFGEVDGNPMICDGALTVVMYDESTSGQSVMVEQWVIDPATLNRLVRKDIIGLGYTLFLPSARYKPEMSTIRLKSCYQRKNAAPLFTENVVTLAPENGVIHEQNKSVQLPRPRQIQ